MICSNYTLASNYLPSHLTPPPPPPPHLCHAISLSPPPPTPPCAEKYASLILWIRIPI